MARRGRHTAGQLDYAGQVPTEPARSTIIKTIVGWFDLHARALPWRTSSAWGVMVSEFMLQQTPVSRVLPVWSEWLGRWPEPADLAAEPSSAAVAAWGRLGYPRRALRLHTSATAIVDHCQGLVPASVERLRALPGVGDYTASAIAAFAFGRAVPVLDTNVRRVYARLLHGQAMPSPHIRAAERVEAERWTAAAGQEAARWAAAVMEFGALVCTAKAPACPDCPLAGHCRWLRVGQPPASTPPRRQPWQGTDRQCRGALLDLIRVNGVLSIEVLLDGWPDRDQAERCLSGLGSDGLVHLDGGLARL